MSYVSDELLLGRDENRERVSTSWICGCNRVKQS